MCLRKLPWYLLLGNMSNIHLKYKIHDEILLHEDNFARRVILHESKKTKIKKYKKDKEKPTCKLKIVTDWENK